MRKPVRPAQERSSPLRRLVVAEADIAAAQRLLEVVVKAASPGSGAPFKDPLSGPVDRGDMIRRARTACELRERRLHSFTFHAEAPFALLLVLYANEEWEPIVTLTRLTHLAWMSVSTCIRWLEVLETQGLINRKDDAEDKRKTLVSLSAKGGEVSTNCSNSRAPGQAAEQSRQRTGQALSGAPGRQLGRSRRGAARCARSGP